MLELAERPHTTAPRSRPKGPAPLPAAAAATPDASWEGRLERLLPTAYRLARCVLGSESAALEALEGAAVEARHVRLTFGTLPGPTERSAFLALVARRAMGRRVHAPTAPAGETGLEELPTLEAIDRAMRSLPPLARVAAALGLVLDLSADENAAVLGCDESVAAARIREARSTLREALAGERELRAA